MKPRQPLALTAALASLFLAGSAARAEPVSWSYSWLSTPGVVTSDDGALGHVTFTPGSGGPLTGSVNSGDGILAASLDASGPAAGTATFTNRGYGLTLHLTDNASGTSGDLTFGGALSGTLGSEFKLKNSFSGPTTQKLNLGGNEYIATIGLFEPPQPGTPGRIGANVTVNGSVQSTPPVSEVPEPTSLMLAAAGLSVCGLGGWWRRRRARR
jgi:hypothetical protein